MKKSLEQPAQFLLEAKHYTDPSLLPLEQQRIFQKTWLYVGDAQTLSPGEVWVKTIAGLPLIITCDASGRYQAFYNVCPHRAALLCPDAGVHRAKHLVCPYHAWVYSLEGQLLGTPSRSRLPDDFEFNARTLKSYDLKAVRLEQWSGFIFICLSEDAPPLDTFLDPVPSHLAHQRQASTELLFRQSRRVACNWKNYHDNTLCDYHVAIAHRTTLHQLQGPIQRYQYQFSTYINLLYTPTLQRWRDHHPALAHLSPLAQNHFLTYGIFPNLHLLAFPDGLFAWIQIEPLTVNTCEVMLEVYGLPQSPASVAALQAEFNGFMAEDEALTESVQQGYASGAYSPGPVSQLEARIVHQQRLILRYMQQES